MQLYPNREDYRELLDAKLTELRLYAKELCPEAKVEISTVRYEDEDGCVYIFPPPLCRKRKKRGSNSPLPPELEISLKKLACLSCAPRLIRRLAECLPFPPWENSAAQTNHLNFLLNLGIIACRRLQGR